MKDNNSESGSTAELMTKATLEPAFWVLMVLLATAVQPILVKLGYRGDASPLQLLVMKNLVSALAVFIYIKHFRLISFDKLGKIGRISVLLLGINGLSLVALQHLPAVIVVTCTTTVPVFVAACNAKMGREQLSPSFWPGLIICGCGVLLAVAAPQAFLSGHLPSGDVWGYLAVAGAICCAVTYRVNMETLTADFSPQLLVIWAFWINAAVVALGICPWVPFISSASLPLGLAIGLSAAIANMAFLWSIKLVGSTLISVLGLLQRPIIILATAFLLGEVLHLSQWLGIALVLAGLPLARPQRQKKAI